MALSAALDVCLAQPDLQNGSFRMRTALIAEDFPWNARTTVELICFSCILARDQHAVAFAPSDPNFVVIGNDGGIDYSTNSGVSWGYSSTPCDAVLRRRCRFQQFDLILGGTQDNGTVRTLDGSLDTWRIFAAETGSTASSTIRIPRVYAAPNTVDGKIDGWREHFLGATQGLDLTYTN
jgi:hypothetical protein